MNADGGSLFQVCGIDKLVGKGCSVRLPLVYWCAT